MKNIYTKATLLLLLAYFFVSANAIEAKRARSTRKANHAKVDIRTNEYGQLTSSRKSSKYQPFNTAKKFSRTLLLVIGVSFVYLCYQANNVENSQGIFHSFSEVLEAQESKWNQKNQFLTKLTEWSPVDYPCLIFMVLVTSATLTFLYWVVDKAFFSKDDASATSNPQSLHFQINIPKSAVQENTDQYAELLEDVYDQLQKIKESIADKKENAGKKDDSQAKQIDDIEDEAEDLEEEADIEEENEEQESQKPAPRQTSEDDEEDEEDLIIAGFATT